jgi:hypothetical protein
MHQLSRRAAMPAALALLAVAAALPLRADTAAPAQATGQITVTGEGRVEAAPDMATLTLGVTTEARTAAEAMAANSAQLTRVLERLRSAGIADRDMQTTGLSLNPNWQSGGDGAAPRITGYVAGNMLAVRLRDLDATGQVLEAAIGDGANTFNGLSFGLTDPAAALTEARRRAVADALARARLLAEAAGLTLGPVLSISEGGSPGGPGPMFRMEAAADAPVPVLGGEVATEARVTMVFALVP